MARPASAAATLTLRTLLPSLLRPAPLRTASVPTTTTIGCLATSFRSAQTPSNGRPRGTATRSFLSPGRSAAGAAVELRGSRLRCSIASMVPDRALSQSLPSSPIASRGLATNRTASKLNGTVLDACAAIRLRSIVKRLVPTPLGALRLSILPSLLHGRWTHPPSSHTRTRRPSPSPSNPPASRSLSPLLLLRTLPPTTLIHLLLLLNTLIFLLWQLSLLYQSRFHDARLLAWMCSHFLSGEPNLVAGRWWTLLTCCFSHIQPAHFLFNMLSLYFMAPPVAAVCGNATFLALYLGAGVVGSIVSIVWHRSLVPLFGGKRDTKRQSLGASGSVYATMSTFACLQPHATFVLFFVLPLPAWVCVSGIFAWDIYNATFSNSTQIDSAGHIGGMVAGVLFWRFGLRGMRI